MPKVLAFAGSIRTGSFNQMLIKVAVERVRAAGLEVTLIDLADYPLPLYNGDLEAKSGQPENSEKLYKLFLEHDALLLACPEYNSSITPLLKNTIDWVSRPREGDEYLAAYQGKVIALTSASPGGLGGMRALAEVRSIFGNIGSLVIPTQVAVPKADKAFSDEGELTDDSVVKKLDGLAEQFVKVTKRIAEK
ncbi:MAG: NAD(P)H-dependent oxidoreductase [Pirellulaceae bacterium]